MITQFQNDLYLISLPVDVTGFENFIGAWVYLGKIVAVVDVGPTSTAHVLLSGLAELGVQRPDAILLTHIHIDHAGGISAIAQAFPQTPVVCHPKGVPHLIDPQNLWRGSQKTLGNLAAAYGEIGPVPGNQVVSSDDFEMVGVRTVQSPGHASHHISYAMDKVLFAGEAAGVCLPITDGNYYLRPATPPRFFLETSLASIDALTALDSERICYGHLGMRPDSQTMLAAHRRQLLRWYKMLAFQYEKYQGNPEVALSSCVESLLANDPDLAGFQSLSAEVQSREIYFLKNSVRGFCGYLDTLGRKTKVVPLQKT